VTSSAEPPPRLDALLRDALASEDARLAALEARVSALRRAPKPATPAPGPAPPVKDGTTKVDLQAHPGHPGDHAAALLARAARASMVGDGPGYEDTVPIPAAKDEPAAPDLDDERLEAARRILLESSQSLAELRACLAGVTPDDASQPGARSARPTSVAPPWALELVEGVATLHGSLARLEQLLVEVGRAVAAVLERSRPGPAPAPYQAAPATRESPTGRLRRVLSESARRTGERSPSSTARAALQALDATVDGGARRPEAERKAILEAFELLAKVIPRLDQR
jgi:hypothetical protein